MEVGVLKGIPSCGLTLLTTSEDTFDYVLTITESGTTIRAVVHAHRCVLAAHSGTLRRMMTDENFFELDVTVNAGYLSATLQLLQYMYLKDATLLTHKPKVQELCVFFDMPTDHFLITNETALAVLNKYPVQLLSINDACFFRMAEPFKRCLHHINLLQCNQSQSQCQSGLSCSRSATTDDTLSPPPPNQQEEECGVLVASYTDHHPSKTKPVVVVVSHSRDGDCSSIDTTLGTIQPQALPQALPRMTTRSTTPKKRGDRPHNTRGARTKKVRL
jgi:hypothetical protein